MNGEPGLAEKVVRIHDALDRAGMPHAIGGALALAYYGEPRVTIDVDINLFVAAEEFPEVAGLLTPLGVNAEADPRQVERDGQVRIWWGLNPLDLFFEYDPFHEAMADDSRVVPFADGTIPILSPEHLIVCKAVFDRVKDWLDIEQMIIAVPELRHAEIVRWLARIAGDGDQRFERFEQVWRENR